MNSAEAFKAWWKQMLQEHIDPSLKVLCMDTWEAACAWQREQDAKIAETDVSCDCETLCGQRHGIAAAIRTAGGGDG